MTLPAFAAERPAPAAIDRHLLPQGAQQQIRRPELLLSISGTDRRRTDARPMLSVL